MIGDATFSMADNKLRLYPAARLDPETYERVRAAGFRWAPKQELFFAPAWTPEREDLLIELCGDVGDDGMSLAERAADRAVRFEEYSVKRAADAEVAKAAVDRIADGIPLGQPLLVSHHSEKHARKDAERIERGMAKTVAAWRKSKRWAERAKASVAHAEMKEKPAVRARRIKTLEADERKWTRSLDGHERMLKLWTKLHEPDSVKRKDGRPTSFLDRAKHVANHDHLSRRFPLAEFPRTPPVSQYEGDTSLWSALTDGVIGPMQAQAIAVEIHERGAALCRRWIEHLALRLEWERTMLAGSGGTAADRTGPEKGGAVQCWASPSGGWSIVQKVNKTSVSIIKSWLGGAPVRMTMAFDKLGAVMTAAEVVAAREAGRVVEMHEGGFWLAGEFGSEPTKAEIAEATEATVEKLKAVVMGEELRDWEGRLRSGEAVKVVSAPDLFPTPRELARRMVQAAGIMGGERVLEPSAGTGELVRAIQDAATGADNVRIVAVEINGQVADALVARWNKILGANEETMRIVHGDFLEQTPEVLGLFNAVVMNPPFSRGADTKHVRHALTFLRPGGRLVALVADGPGRREALEPVASSWEPLGQAFKDQGTSVSVAMVVIDKEDSDAN